MSLQGSLRKLGLADVLQTLLAGRQGNLYLRSGAKRATVHVAAHQLRLCEPDPVDPSYMLDGFVQRGILDEGALTAGRRSKSDPIDLVDELIEQGVLSRPEVDDLLRAAAEDAILDLLTWQKGDFRFEEGEPLPPASGLAGRVPVDVGGVLLRAAQRFDERAEIAAHLGAEAHLFVPLGEAPEPEYEDDPLLDVHALLDAHRVVDEIALLAGVPRFAALRAMLICVKAGAARLADADELRHETEARIAAGQTSVARALMLQWAGQEPDDPAPLMSLAELAKFRKSVGEEADALLALGNLHLQRGEPTEALEVFRDLSERRPGDGRVLSALCAAAEVAGDTDLHTRATVQLAAEALKEDEPQRAAQLLTRVVSDAEAPLAARILHARALVRLRDRDGLMTEAEAAAAQLGSKAKTREERDAADYFRDAVATLVPERGDLLRHFRSLSSKETRWKPIALAGALVVLVAAAGVVFWPEGPGKILAQAEEAAAAGDFTTAYQLISTLAEEHPDSPEASEALALQQRIQQQNSPPPPEDPLSGTNTAAEIRSLAIACAPRLRDLPSEEARASLAELARRLAAPDALRFRRSILKELDLSISDAANRMEREARSRVDALAHMRDLAQDTRTNLETLEQWVAKSRGFLTDDFPAQLEDAVGGLESLIGGQPNTTQMRMIRSLHLAIEQLKRARSRHKPDVSAVRGRLLGARLEELHQRCRTEASRELVAGRYEEADALYASLGEQLSALAVDPDRGSLHEEAQRRGLPAFVTDRRAMIQEIRSGLEGAKAAEDAGDLDAAIRAYAALVRRFWHIRFENVIKLPLAVTSTPAGATIRLNGAEVGVAPTVVRCPWGTQLTLTVEAPGFAKATRFIDPGPSLPASDIHVALEPAHVWEVGLDRTVSSAPVPIGGDLITVDRTGRVQRLEGKDGRVMWARHIETLEGIKARPIVTGGIVHLPFVDGTLYLLSARDGSRIAEVKIGRPVGEAAVLDDDVAIAGLGGKIRIVRGRDDVQTVSIGAPPSAGVVAAHGSYWVGTAVGEVKRISPLGVIETVGRSKRQVGVVGLAASADGMLVTRGDGSLEALDVAGGVRWRREALGHLVGSPAPAADFAATIDSRGRVLLFGLRDGSPQGQVDLDGFAPHGLLGTGGNMIAALEDGRLWIYDPTTETEVAHVNLGGRAQFAPADLEDGLFAAPSRGDGLTVFAMPTAPTVAAPR